METDGQNNTVAHGGSTANDKQKDKGDARDRTEGYGGLRAMVANYPCLPHGLIPGIALYEICDHFGIVGYHEVTCVGNSCTLYASHTLGLIALDEGGQVGIEK